MRLHKGLSNGRLYLSIVEGYRDPITKKVKTRTLRSLGYADSLAKIHSDPVAFGMRTLEEMKLAAACEHTADKVSIHSNERLSDSVSYNKLLGYAPLSMLYCGLGLDQFFTNQARKLHSMSIPYFPCLVLVSADKRGICQSIPAPAPQPPSLHNV
ncbi:hypothetical protein AGMMS49992_02900 [Clostridia bacterium]|nr:hypothetical protein AGMMS49992_02900 [Clostridia bacterium]